MNHLGGDGWAGLIPFGSFLMPIKLLTCVVQAMIFCLLMSVYLSLVTSHHEEAEGNDPDGHRGPMTDAFNHGLPETAVATH
jgi:F-type H+-transporting ATPase subunit a